MIDLRWRGGRLTIVSVHAAIFIWNNPQGHADDALIPEIDPMIRRAEAVVLRERNSDGAFRSLRFPTSVVAFERPTAET
jgi:hypothetical protein